ncbi:MAG: Gfo/Idh/MocA family oxidoreductase [Verrucomicrobia bacterium]|nr:Gfo/Idh/MocA family oxidoreductase [Verrucomicrobiota bacterium]
MEKIGIAIIGCGGITLQNHLPGLALCPQTRIVALCDSDPATLQRASQQCGVAACYTDYTEVLKRDDLNAVVIATPNVLHAPIALAAIKAGKHVLCEKPLAMNSGEALEMYRAAETAGVRHMTAFTYRFVPAFRYMAHLVKSGAIGQPYHLRVQRFQDWGQRSLGWRQVARMAGSGELGDMLSHRLDYAHLLVGQMRSLVGDLHRFHDARGGQASDLEDWTAIIARFANAATGVFESSKLVTGRGESARSHDYCEINGSEATIVYQMSATPELHMGRPGSGNLETVPVPREFLTWPGSPRDPSQGDPLFNFRYDQNFEFVDAIVKQRPCVPSFLDGARVQEVMDTAIQSARERRWLDVRYAVPWK